MKIDKVIKSLELIDELLSSAMREFDDGKTGFYEIGEAQKHILLLLCNFDSSYIE